MRRQFLLQMAGMSGAGKSSLARTIGKELGAIVVDKDLVKSAALDSGGDWELSGRIGYGAAQVLTADFLRQGFSVILDTPCHFPQTLECATALAAEHNVPLGFIECVLPDPSILRQRLQERPRLRSQPPYLPASPPNGPNAPSTTLDGPYGASVVCHPPGPWIRIDTRQSPEECLAQALAYLSGLLRPRLMRSVTTRYLEMTDPSKLRPSRATTEIEVVKAEIPSPELSRFLYTAVGGSWYWTDRLGWSHSRWRAYLDRPEVETWVGNVRGTPAGYFELERQPEGNVEIVYFGLLAAFIGKGLGGRLLTHAVERAWESGTRRVWVHTCTLDGPAALRNYLARGFRLYHEETHEVDLPSRPPGPWPGANTDKG